MTKRDQKTDILACPYELSDSGPFQGPWNLDDLTGREKQVLLYLGSGLTNREIAKHLAIAERTVKAHLARILAKLGQRSRLQAAVISVLSHTLLCADTRCSCHRPQMRPYAA